MIADKNISGTPVLKNTEAESESAYVKIYQQNGEWVKRKVSKINDHTQRDYGAGRAECSKENPLKKYLSRNYKSKCKQLFSHQFQLFFYG